MSKQAVVVNLLDTLTEHEQVVFDLVLLGLRREDIAERLSIAVGTVKYHLNHIYNKLDVRGRAEAVAYAATVGRVPAVEAKVVGVGAVSEGWSEDDLRAAAAELVKQGLGDRKVVNAVVTDLLLALHKKL